MHLHVDESARPLLRELFRAVEGSCESWSDDEIARRLLVRGAMDYAKRAGRSWDDVTALAEQVRAATTTAG